MDFIYNILTWIFIVTVTCIVLEFFIGSSRLLKIIKDIGVISLSLAGFLFIMSVIIIVLSKSIIPIVLHLLITPLYLFYDIPNMPMTDFHFMIDLFFLCMLAGVFVAYYCVFWYNKITKIIGTVVLLGFCTLTAVNTTIFYANKVNSMEDFLYVHTLNNFKNSQFNSGFNPKEYNENLKNTPFYRKLEAEIEKPTLDKDLIKEINLFKEYQGSKGNNYFLDMEDENNFRMKYGFSNNQEEKIDFAKIIADGHISLIEQKQFEKKWKR